ncbi:hypothetical protein ABZP36_009480 [Zizania latifolia]
MKFQGTAFNASHCLFYPARHPRGSTTPTKAAADTTPEEEYAAILDPCFHLARLSSVAGLIAYPALVSVYSLTKGDTHQLTRSLAASASTASPAPRSATATRPWARQEMSQVPMRLSGKPQEVRRSLLCLVAFLCTPAAGYITGQVICLDGGRAIAAELYLQAELVHATQCKCSHPNVFANKYPT